MCLILAIVDIKLDIYFSPLKRKAEAQFPKLG